MQTKEPLVGPAGVQDTSRWAGVLRAAGKTVKRTTITVSLISNLFICCNSVENNNNIRDLIFSILVLSRLGKHSGNFELLIGILNVRVILGFIQFYVDEIVLVRYA